MTLDLANFTPWTSLAGGALIGLGAALLLGVNGRIAGISGIVGTLLAKPYERFGWRLFFVLGLLAAPLAGLLPGSFGWPEIRHQVDGWAGWLALAIGGVLVGYGTRLANGCTSGHGVCGLARFSGRSLCAVAVFMATGFATVFIVRHVFGG